MYEIQTKMHVDGLSGQEVYDFLIEPDDISYQAWWPGTHLECHYVRKTANYVGSVVYMDEFVGERRVKMKGLIRDVVPGRRIVWQALKFIVLPITLSIELQDDETGTNITHTIRVGHSGIRRVFDPFLRLYLSPRFARAMDDHARTEFPKLRDMLHAVK